MRTLESATPRPGIDSGGFGEVRLSRFDYEAPMASITGTEQSPAVTPTAGLTKLATTSIHKRHKRN